MTSLPWITLTFTYMLLAFPSRCQDGCLFLQTPSHDPTCDRKEWRLGVIFSSRSQQISSWEPLISLDHRPQQTNYQLWPATLPAPLCFRVKAQQAPSCHQWAVFFKRNWVPGTPCFMLLHFITLHRCVFHRLEGRLSASKVTAHLVERLALLWGLDWTRCVSVVWSCAQKVNRCLWVEGLQVIFLPQKILCNK